MNLRELVAILLTVFENQVAAIIQNVVYDKELFNYEEYKARGLATQKTLTKLVFLRSGKHLVQEYYKMQADLPFHKLFSNYERVQSYLAHMTVHLPTLFKIESLQFVPLEPILLVFYSNLSPTMVAKDGLSKVSKNFFKDLKLNYRRPEFAQTLIDVHRFFEWHDESVRSFIHFQIMITCENLIEEHANFTYTVLRDRAFGEKEG